MVHTMKLDQVELPEEFITEQILRTVAYVSRAGRRACVKERGERGLLAAAQILGDFCQGSSTSLPFGSSSPSFPNYFSEPPAPPFQHTRFSSSPVIGENDSGNVNQGAP